MNEDLKKEVYQRVSDYVEDPKNVSILLAKRFANTIKEIYFNSPGKWGCIMLDLETIGYFLEMERLERSQKEEDQEDQEEEEE